MGKLDGKVAVITGASSGIGEAITYSLSEEGAKVVLGARRSDRLTKVAEKINNQNSGTAIALQTDVTNRDEVNQLIDKAKSITGNIDILVNNAGVMLLGPMAERPVDEWRQMMEVNVMGVLYCIKAALPSFIEQKSGYIVNISSVSGRRVTSTGAVYSGTKFALNAITDGLRQELTDHGVRIVSIEPGLVATELPDHIGDDEIRERLTNMENFTKLTSEDIAESVRYAVTQPDHVNVNEILIRPTDQKG